MTIAQSGIAHLRTTLKHRIDEGTDRLVLRAALVRVIVKDWNDVL